MLIASALMSRQLGFLDAERSRNLTSRRIEPEVLAKRKVKHCSGDTLVASRDGTSAHCFPALLRIRCSSWLVLFCGLAGPILLPGAGGSGRFSSLALLEGGQREAKEMGIAAE